MSGFPGPNLVKGGFVFFDAPGAAPRVLAFQYNPTTLTRRLESPFPAPGPQTPGLPAPVPREIITFTLALDAADRLEDGDPVAVQLGVLPLQSALELLVYGPSFSPNSLTVFVSGRNFLLPVRVTALEIVEQMFDGNLNPIQAEIAVTLIVLNSPELSADPHVVRLWQNHLAVLRQLGEIGSQSALSQLGISELP